MTSATPLDVTRRAQNRQPGGHAPGGRETVLDVSGDCDYGTADLLRAAVVEALRDLPRGSTLTLDLSGVRAFDSSGLSALIVAHRHTVRAGVLLTLQGAGDPLLRMLDLTGVGAYFAATRGVPDGPRATAPAGADGAPGGTRAGRPGTSPYAACPPSMTSSAPVTYAPSSPTR